MANYVVKAPSVSVSAAYGAIAVDSNYSFPYPTCPSPDPTAAYLHFGNACNGLGILWRFSATADADEQGMIAMWQLVDYNASVTQPDGTIVSSVSTYNGSETACTDNGIPYETPTPLPASATATWSSVDAPALGLGNASSARIVNHFDDYFMYQAHSLTSGPSVWVSLNRLRWSWDAQTSYTNGAWSPATVNAETAPTVGSAYNSLPTWYCVFNNHV